MQADLAQLVTRLEQCQANPFCWDARTDSRMQRQWRRECESITAMTLRAAQRPTARAPRASDVHAMRCTIEADPTFADGQMMLACLSAARDLIEALALQRKHAKLEAALPQDQV